MSDSRTFGQTDRSVGVAVTAVIVSDARRATVNEVVVTMLMESIRRRGLLSPIRIRTDGMLICGLHRLVAHERLGLKEIAAFVSENGDPVEIELDEIEENLCRKELTVLERGRDELRQKELYLIRNPTTRQGTAGAVARHDGVQAKQISFASARAKDAASGKRIVEQRMQIAAALRDDDAAKLAALPIADNHTQLLELARLPDALRTSVVDRIADGRASKVKDAVGQINSLEVEPKNEHAVHTEASGVSTPMSEVVVDLRACPAEVVLGGRRLRVEVVDKEHVRLTEHLSKGNAGRERTNSHLRSSKAGTDGAMVVTDVYIDALSGPVLQRLAATSLVLRCDAVDLRDALAHVAAVKPRALQPDGRTGYLATVEDGRAHLHSLGARCVARAQFRVRGEQAGRFILPLELAQSLMASAGEITISSLVEGSAFRVRCTGNATDVEADSFDPRKVPADIGGPPTQLKIIDAAVLSEALRASAPFLGTGPLGEDYLEGLLVCSEPGKPSGCLFASNGMQAIWFDSEALQGLNMVISGRDLPLLRRFVAERRRIAISTNETWFFASDDGGHVLGWQRCATHLKHGYLALAQDSPVLRVQKALVLERVKALLPVTEGRSLTLLQRHAARELHLGVGVDESPIAVEVIEAHDADVSARVQPKAMNLLFAGTRSAWVELRMRVIPDGVLMRSVDEFAIHGAPCRVTRFASGLHVKTGDREQ